MIFTLKIPAKIAAAEWPNRHECRCCKLQLPEENFPWVDKKKSVRALTNCLMCRTDCTSRKCRLGQISE